MRPLVNYILERDAGVCWLCGVGSDANSADHEPPRSQLILLGVPNPDDPAYLKASPLVCNQRRGTRPVTDALQAELRRRRLDDIERANITARPSPRFARGTFERT